MQTTDCCCRHYAYQRFFVMKNEYKKSYFRNQSDRPMIESMDNSHIRKLAGNIGVFFLLTFTMLLPSTLSFAANETNRMVSMQMNSVKGNPVLRIVTEKPIGYRYTVYDSNDLNLSSVVISFPFMDIDAVSSITDVNQPPVQRVEVSSDYKAWGRLAQVEVVLSQMADYDITVTDNKFMLTLLLKAGQEKTRGVESISNDNQSVILPASESAEETKHTLIAAPASAKQLTLPASKILNVDVGEQIVRLQADGIVENYKFFSLSNPERLVVDVYGVKLGFESRSFKLPDVFSRMRIGVYQEKLRFVFDASAKVPEYAVTNNGESIVIRWGSGASKATNNLQ